MHLFSEQGCVFIGVPCLSASLSCLSLEPVLHADCWRVLQKPVVLEVPVYLLPLHGFYLILFPP